jgi:hypothetical protein
MSWLAPVLIMGLLAGPAHATDQAAAAERYRLETELGRHAGAARWSGVERTYKKLLALQVPLSTHAHYTAALCAESRGDILETWLRLERALRHENALAVPVDEAGFSVARTVPETVDRSDEVTQKAMSTYTSLGERYGRVSITVGKGRLPALVRLGAKPFGSTERGAITTGQETLAKEKRFVGMLPAGKYMVDGEMFDVAPGELVILKVGER